MSDQKEHPSDDEKGKSAAKWSKEKDFSHYLIHQGELIKNSDDIRPLLKLSASNPRDFEQDVKDKVKEAAKEFGDEQFASLIEKVKPKLKY